MKSVLKKAVPLLGLVLAVIMVRFSQVELDIHRSIRFVNRRPVFLPKGGVLKALTMGYQGLVGDWLWINTVLYYGRRVMDEENPYYLYSVQKGNLPSELSKVQKDLAVSNDTLRNSPLIKIQEELSRHLFRFEDRGLVDYVYPMLDGVTTVDPHFIFPYLFGGVYVLIGTGEIDASLALLQKGYGANPDSWELPFYLGWVNWMYRRDLLKTHRYLMEAVTKPGCRPFVANLLKGVSGDLKKTDVTRLYLESLLQSTNNSDVKKRIETILRDLPK